MANRKQATKTDAAIEVAAQSITPVEGVNEVHLKEHAQRIITINTTVNRLDKEAQALMLEVAYRLGEVKEGNWFVADGFKSINEFGTKILGYKSNMVSKCVQASKRLENHVDVDGNYNVHSIFALYADDDSDKVISDFGLTQLFELASTPDEEIQKGLINGLITHDMSCAKLREFAKSLKGDKVADNKKLLTDEDSGNASTDSKSSDGGSTSTTVSDVSSADNVTDVKAATKADYMRTFKDLDNKQLLMVIDCALQTLIKRGFNTDDVAKIVAYSVKADEPTKASKAATKADEPTKTTTKASKATTKDSKTTKATKTTTKADDVQTI